MQQENITVYVPVWQLYLIYKQSMNASWRVPFTPPAGSKGSPVVLHVI